jgi:hypothetical protein
MTKKGSVTSTKLELLSFTHFAKRTFEGFRLGVAHDDVSLQMFRSVKLFRTKVAFVQNKSLTKMTSAYF